MRRGSCAAPTCRIETGRIETCRIETWRIETCRIETWRIESGVDIAGGRQPG